MHLHHHTKINSEVGGEERAWGALGGGLGVPDGLVMELYDEQDSRSRGKNASRILTDAWLLVSIRDIPGIFFNRHGCFG